MFDAVAAATWRELIVTKILVTRESLLLLIISALCCGLALVNIIVTGGDMSKTGSIQPRKVVLPFFAILWAPFLHENFGTLLMNLFIYILLGSFVLSRSNGIRIFTVVTVAGLLGSGLVMWSLGLEKESFIGLSALIMCYGGYLISWGVFEPESVFSAVLSAITMLIYLGVQLRGLIYWEGAASGCAIGIGCAIVELHRRTQQKLTSEEALEHERKRLVDD